MKNITFLLFFIILTSCEGQEIATDNIKEKEVVQKKIKTYFDAKGIEVTFEKPENFNYKKKVLSFKNLEEFDKFVALSKKNIDFSQKEVFEYDYGDNTIPTGGSSSDGLFITKTIVKNTLLGSIYLNISFVKKNCEPSKLTSWISGNAYTSEYTETNQYLSIKDKTTTCINIQYSVVGTLTTQVEISGMNTYNTSTVSMNGIHYCK